MTYFKMFFLFLTFLPVLGHASTHEEIVEQFISLQSRRQSSEPSRTIKYKIPKLDQVIPRSLQRQLRAEGPQAKPNYKLYRKNQDLRFRDTPIMSQVGPRCTAYGLVAAIENLLNAPQIAKLSEAHLWSRYRQYSSVSAVEAGKRMAITEAKAWPHNRKNPYSGWSEKSHTTLENITFIGDNIEKAIAALDGGRPVYIGFSVSHSLAACDAVLNPNSSPNGGGHAVSISGFGIDERVSGGGYFILKNSWGKDCGEEGYHYMPFNYCTRGGRSYCAMWDLQGVETKFPGVSSVIPKVPKFDVSEMNVRISSDKLCLKRSRRVSINLSGNSLHARQIKEVSYSLDGEEFSRPVVNDIDTVDISFLSPKSSHDIFLKIILNNGEVVDGQYQWEL